MEAKSVVLSRTRSRINAAKGRLHKSWEDVFGRCDKDNSGCLDFHEFEGAIRTILCVPENGICSYELKTVFNEIDADRSGGVNIEELLNYLTKGYRTPEEVASRAQVRIQRVRRALRMAFQGISSNDAVLRKLFVKLDLDSNQTLSLYEFKQFVRMELKLSFWDVNNSDVEEFYAYLDKDHANGIMVHELIAFVKSNNSGRPKTPSFMEPVRPSSAPDGEQKKRLMRKKTFKQALLEDKFRSSSLPDLSKMKYTASVVSQGRSVMPATRSSLTKSSQMFFDPSGPERRLTTK